MGPRTWTALDAIVGRLEDTEEHQEPPCVLRVYDVHLLGVAEDVAQAIRKQYPRAIVQDCAEV